MDSVNSLYSGDEVDGILHIFVRDFVSPENYFVETNTGYSM
jgi:hypothetical protein